MHIFLLCFGGSYVFLVGFGIFIFNFFLSFNCLSKVLEERIWTHLFLYWQWRWHLDFCSELWLHIWISRGTASTCHFCWTCEYFSHYVSFSVLFCSVLPNSAFCWFEIVVPFLAMELSQTCYKLSPHDSRSSLHNHGFWIIYCYTFQHSRIQTGVSVQPMPWMICFCE